MGGIITILGHESASLIQSGGYPSGRAEADQTLNIYAAKMAFMMSTCTITLQLVAQSALWIIESVSAAAENDTLKVRLQAAVQCLDVARVRRDQIHTPEVVMHQAFGKDGSLVRVEVVVTVGDLRGKWGFAVSVSFALADVV